jgi:hypothetical protein
MDKDTMLKIPTLGDRVKYVGKLGASSPRVAFVTSSYLDVQPGTDLIPLSSPMHVYLWVFTPRSVGFPESDVPYDPEGAPGTWSWFSDKD